MEECDLGVVVGEVGEKVVGLLLFGVEDDGVGGGLLRLVVFFQAAFGAFFEEEDAVAEERVEAGEGGCGEGAFFLAIIS